VDQPCGVYGRESLARGDQRGDDLAPAPALLGKPSLQRRALDELHRDEHAIADPAEIMTQIPGAWRVAADLGEAAASPRR
jgi:hypothetical protein